VAVFCYDLQRKHRTDRHSGDVYASVINTDLALHIQQDRLKEECVVRTRGRYTRVGTVASLAQRPATGVARVPSVHSAACDRVHAQRPAASWSSKGTFSSFSSV
jgi:hypothetical protein